LLAIYAANLGIEIDGVVSKIIDAIEILGAEINGLNDPPADSEWATEIAFAEIGERINELVDH